MALVPVKNDVGANRPGGGFRGGAVYRWLVTSPLAAPLVGALPGGKGACEVPLLWPGETRIGQQMLDGLFEYFGEAHDVAIAAALPDMASKRWVEWFHSLGWLVDLKATGNSEAPSLAQRMAGEWIEANSHWDPVSWRPEIAAERIFNCLGAWNMLVAGTDGSFTQRLLGMLGRDTRHILHSLPSGGYPRLKALKGYVFAAHALYGREKMKSDSIKRLQAEVAAQLLADGCHIQRNPEILSQVLKDLLDTRAMLATLGEEVPGWLQGAIDRAAPMLRMLRHPDGGLALFNGGGIGESSFLDQLLLQSGSTAAMPVSAPYGGFERISAGTTHIIMDTGMPCADGHAGTLSFEMSIGARRMIVNCGARGENDGGWREALAATAAHSTLTVNDTSSSAERAGRGGGGRRGPSAVKHKRADNEDEGTVVEASHDGYETIFGLVHHRAIFTDPSGRRVLGEDRLVGTGGEHFAIRFHLHPRAHASMLGSGEGVLIKLGRGEMWRFSVNGASLSLEESIYATRLGMPKHTEQIVVSGPLSGNGVLVKWSFTGEEG